MKTWEVYFQKRRRDYQFLKIKMESGRKNYAVASRGFTEM